MGRRSPDADRPTYATFPAVAGKLSILRELWTFLRVRKKWWLAPIVLLLVALGGLLAVAQGSALAPFIYSLF